MVKIELQILLCSKRKCNFRLAKDFRLAENQKQAERNF
jgi:hypothetical protein